MPRLIWSVLCEKVITDAPTNSVSYINCVEGVRAEELPVQLPPIAVATLWARESNARESLQVKIRLLAPDGSVQQLLKSDPVLMERPKHRLNVQLVGLSLDKEGTYYFQVYQKAPKRWKRVSEIPFTLRLRERERASPTG